MFVEKGEDYMKALLARAKGSLLEVSIDQDVRVSTMALLSRHSQRIRSLEFKRDYWKGIRKFSEANPGPFPLLRTLIVTRFYTHDSLEDDTPPLSPFLANNVEEFFFDSAKIQFLNHFVFPNLTMFNLRTEKVSRSGASDLFGFLKASPMLRTVRICIFNGIMVEDIPGQTVIVLPNVETFSLASDDRSTYKIALRISCPRARDVSLMCQVSDVNISPSWEIFPKCVSWNTIVHQYAESPVEEVTLVIRPPYETSSLTFRSSDTSTIRLVFELSPDSDYIDEVDMDLSEVVYKAFSQGFKTIHNHPLLTGLKRFHLICGDLGMYGSQTLIPATVVKKVLECVGPLDILTINGCHLRPYLAGFGKLGYSKQRVVFPPIKQLTISHPWMETDEEKYMGAIVKLAESQYARGIPFERVTVRANILPTGMAERLRKWVGTADCEEDSFVED